jgi:PKD repeat protein
MQRRKLSAIFGLLAAGFVVVSAASAGVNISKSPNWESWAPRVAADSAGNFYVVWVELYSKSSGDAFFAKYTKSTKTWSTPKNLSNSGGVTGESQDNCGIAADDSDNIHVVWAENSIVRMRSLAGGTWTEAGTIGEGNQLEGAKVAATGDGNLYFVWYGRDGIVRSRARVNGNWESVKQISSRARSKFADIAVGNASVIVVFAQKGSYYYNAAYTIRAVTYGAGWSAPSVASPEERDQIYPDVEFLNGTTPNIVFGYENMPGEGARISHCAWTGSGFGSPQKISRDETVHCPSLVATGSGLVAVWQVGGWNNGVSVDYNIFSGGEWATPIVIPNSSGGTYGDAAFDPSGTGLAVWDGDGEIWALLITREEPPPDNKPPVALFSFSPTTGSAPLEVNFNAGASYDPDGTIVSYAWSFGDGKSGSGKTVSHTFAKPGTFTAELIVVDNQGASATAMHSLEVVNQPPVAGFSIAPDTGIVPVRVAFDAAASYDPDGKIVLYDWIFSDGFTAQGKTIERDFSLSGTYSVKLTVTDNFSTTASKIKSFVLLGIKPPLNVRWASFTDSSLFMTRTVTDVQWDANPANDAIAEIAKYRVFRKPAVETGASYQLCGETDGATFLWRDTDVETAGQYAYAVTAMDAAGHESSAPGLMARNGSGKFRGDDALSGNGSSPVRH